MVSGYLSPFFTVPVELWSIFLCCVILIPKSCLDDTGAAIAYLNTGKGNDISWAPLNDGKPIALGVGKGKGVHFATMGGEKQVDYLYVDEKSGAVHLYENKGSDDNSPGKWKWIGPQDVASGQYFSEILSPVLVMLWSMKSSWVTLTPKRI